MPRLQLFQTTTRVKGLFVDTSLTKKAYLNALSSVIDYASHLIVALVITPFMVSSLGDYYYGVWQILNRIVGYLSPASGRPTQALRSTLANQQVSNDYGKKRRSVGSAIAVWILFFPFLGVGGGALVWFIPFWLKAPPDSYLQVRLTTLLLVVNLMALNVVILPQSILQGENLGYKRIGLAAVLTMLSGIFTWAVLQLKLGIVGVAVVALSTTIFTGFLYLRVTRANITWYGIESPSFHEFGAFLKLSLWFMAWTLIMQLMMASDVIVLGFLESVESVTSYSLTKYVPETAISLIAIIISGAVPGLGGIIGSGDLRKATHIRNEIMSISWLMLAVLGTTILMWNRVFLSLWVGETRFAGEIPNLLIVLVVTQFVLIRNDASIIDLTLRLQHKVILGALSAMLAITTSAILVGHYHLGTNGLCLGLIIGRSVLSLAYPGMIGKFLGVSLRAQLKGSIRPAMVTLILFGLAFLLSDLHYASHFSGIQGWILFIIMVGLTVIFVLVISFYFGLHSQQRKNILIRLKYVLSSAVD